MTLAQEIDHVEETVREQLLYASIVKVASDLEISQANLFRIVRGGPMKVETLRKLAAYFDANPHDTSSPPWGN